MLLELAKGRAPPQGAVLEAVRSAATGGLLRDALLLLLLGEGGHGDAPDQVGREPRHGLDVLAHEVRDLGAQIVLGGEDGAAQRNSQYRCQTAD